MAPDLQELTGEKGKIHTSGKNFLYICMEPVMPIGTPATHPLPSL